jgi:hypothetical protein
MADPEGGPMMTQEFNRLEAKVDSLLEAVTKLVLFEERQSVQAATIKTLGIKVDKVEKDLDKWVQRGIGVWAFAVTTFTLYQSLQGTT